MPTGKITKRSVDGLASGEKDVLLWDEDLHGFGVKITPAGTKTYLVQYRLGGRSASTKRYTIGRHGTWTPITARLEAERVLRLANTGVDPQALALDHERRQRDLGFAGYSERFLLEYGKRHWRERTYAAAESNLRRWIVPVLGNKMLPAVARRDIVEVFDKLPASSPALPRNLFALMRKLFTWAAERGDIDRSPFDQMRSPPSVAARDRVLTDNELRLIILFAEDLGAPFNRLILLLIITGQRRDEVSGMTWGELNRSRAEWTMSGDRTKNARAHIVPLNRIALAELDTLAGSDQWPEQGFVFTTNDRTAISGYSRAKSRLDRIITASSGRPLLAWRIHDLRRTFATNMQRLDVRFEVTEALLNHISGARGGVAGVYQRHDWATEKRDAMDKWADKLSALLTLGDPNQCGDEQEDDGEE